MQGEMDHLSKSDQIFPNNVKTKSYFLEVYQINGDLKLKIIWSTQGREQRKLQRMIMIKVEPQKANLSVLISRNGKEAAWSQVEVNLERKQDGKKRRGAGGGMMEAGTDYCESGNLSKKKKLANSFILCHLMLSI